MKVVEKKFPEKLKSRCSVSGLKPNIFDFNPISKDLPEEVQQTQKKFYKFYYKKWRCYSKTFNIYKRKSLSLTLLAAGSIISGAVAGGVTLNPIVIVVLTSVILL